MASKILNLGNKDCGEEEEEPPVSNSGTSSGTSSSSSKSGGYRDDPLGPFAKAKATVLQMHNLRRKHLCSGL